MAKLKQATLFSLKSWEKTSTSDILNSRNVLEKEQDIFVIMQTLSTLKKKRPSRTVVISTALDATLLKLRDHSSQSVSCCATNLLKEWNLLPPEPKQLDPNPESKDRPSCDADTPDAKPKTVPFKTAPNQHNQKNVLMQTAPNQQKQKNVLMETPPNQQNQKPVPKITPPNQQKPAEEAPKNKNVPKVMKHSKAEYSNLVKSLQKAVDLFALELGQQEVEIYLNCIL